MPRTFSCTITGAVLLILSGNRDLWADEPPAPTAPAVVVPAPPNPPVMQMPATAGQVPLRDKLFHWHFLSHAKEPCRGCASVDPDFGCSTCHEECIFLFGSCRAFYGERWR